MTLIPTNIQLNMIVIACSMLVTSCFPVPKDSDDAGHASFVYAAYPILLGERPSGINEIEVLADVAKLAGREVVVEMLMNDPRFVNHWSNIIVDMLEIQREYSNTLPAQDASCWNKPTRYLDSSIARWVRRKAPRVKLDPRDGAPKPGWNMADLLASAIAVDDLSVIYKANLFPMATRRSGTAVGDNREVLTDQLLRIYLNRDFECLRCHNPTFSVSNKTDSNDKVIWRRLWAVPGHPEKALFGNYYSESTVLSRIRPIMRGDIRKRAQKLSDAQDKNLPWGINKNCVKETSDISHKNNENRWDINLKYVGFQNIPGNGKEYPNIMFGSLNGNQNSKVSLWELEALFDQGVRALRQGYSRLKAPPKLTQQEKQFCDVVQVFNSSCVGCHSGDTPEARLLDLSGDNVGTMLKNSLSTTGLLFVKPTMPNKSTIWQRVKDQNSQRPKMPPTFKISQRSVDKIKDWISSGATTVSTSQCNISHVPNVSADKGFAFLVAMNIVDGIWETVMGSPLTISHGYPRNRHQRDMLWNLTEFEFVKKGWSLQAVLKKILTSDWFARRAPNNSLNTDKYSLPAILNPWVVADPNVNSNYVDAKRYNGFGALIHRHRVDSILGTIAKALNWEKPNRFPASIPAGRRFLKKYPDNFEPEIGRFYSPKTPGFDDVSFQSLLAYESEIGLCYKKDHVRGGGSADDWIDTLVKSIDSHNSSNSTSKISYGDVWKILKDRLLQDPTINKTSSSGKDPEKLIMAVFKKPSSKLTQEFPGSKTEIIRQACGTILKSPQFLLSHMPPKSYTYKQLPTPPRLSVCIKGEPCGYDQLCGYWVRHLSAMGFAIGCRNRSVYQKPVSLPSGPQLPSRPLPGPVVPTPEVPRPLPSGELPGGSSSPSPLPAPDILTSLDPVGSTFVTEELAPTFDPSILIEDDNIVLDLEWLKAQTWLPHVRKRVENLCPLGQCGFLKTVETYSCRDYPTQETCLALMPTCDPRSRSHKSGVNLCHSPQADIRDHGVLVAWLEGAVATAGAGVLVNRANEWGWSPIGSGFTLRAGDLVYIPLDSSFKLHDGIIDIQGLGISRVLDIEGHILAITGPSIRQVMGSIQAQEVDAIRNDLFMLGVKSEKYESRGATQEDWEQIAADRIQPGSMPMPTLNEVMEWQSNYEYYHRGLGHDEDNL